MRITYPKPRPTPDRNGVIAMTRTGDACHGIQTGLLPAVLMDRRLSKLGLLPSSHGNLLPAQNSAAEYQNTQGTSDSRDHSRWVAPGWLPRLKFMLFNKPVVPR